MVGVIMVSWQAAGTPTHLLVYCRPLIIKPFDQNVAVTTPQEEQRQRFDYRM